MSSANYLEPKYKAVYEAWAANPNKNNTAVLLQAVNPVLQSAVRIYAPDMTGNPVFHSKARLIAMEALKSYNPAKGKLASHLLTWLQRLQRAAGQSRQIVRMPERLILDQQLVMRATSELHDKLGRPPSDAELMDYTGISKRRLQKIRQAVSPVAEGRIEALTTTDESGPGQFATKSLAQPDNALLEFVYLDLPATDQYILERSVGLHGHTKQSVREIAKALKTSPATISRRLGEIQKTVDEMESLLAR